MKEHGLIKKLENQAAKYKQRAHKSPIDRKRHDRIEHDEQKMMRVAYNQLGWSYAKIASFFDRDSRTVAGKVQENSQVKGKPSGQGDESSLATNASSTPQEKSGACPAPPDDMDVARLKRWKIKSSQAAMILAAWRKCHKYGVHSQCSLYKQLIEDLKNKIPFEIAKVLLRLGRKAERYGSKEAHRLAEECRLYRSWESKENYEAFIREFKDLPRIKY